jgi:hypothetical protein
MLAYTLMWGESIFRHRETDTTITVQSRSRPMPARRMVRNSLPFFRAAKTL